MGSESGPRSHVALLRGINVGGHRRMAMDDLRALCESLGLSDVETHIQSGNVVFDVDRPAADVAADLEAAIEGEFGYDVPVVVRDREEYAAILEAAPFDDLDGTEEAKLYVTFLHSRPGDEAATAIEAESDEIETYVVDDRAVYSVVRRGTNERKRFSNDLVESTLGVAGTTRNWAVTRRLGELLG